MAGSGGLAGLLAGAAGELRALLAAAEAEEAERGAEQMVAGRLGPLLGPAIPALARLLAGTQTDSWAGLERTIASGYRDSHTREAHEDLLAVEADWTTFLSRLDRGLGCGAGAAVAGLGDTLEAGTPLWDARTGEKVSLGSLLGGQQCHTVHLVLLRHFA